ncbi:hypothetical protein LguiB_004683 [Lonicera macranthoides]
MKESGQMQASGEGTKGLMTSSSRSAVDKERTKIRERQRRSITTKIFHGLRKHGGYRLSPRADINEVLRHLAFEAGWIVEPDGTTYRSTSTTTSNVYNVCAACGAGRRSGTPTPTSSFIGGGAAGECSTTASPRQVTVVDSSMLAYGAPPTSIYYPGISSGGASGSGGVSDPDNTRGVCMFGRLSSGLQSSTTTAGGASAVTLAAYQQQQQVYQLHEARASNQNTPVASPLRRV